MRSSIVNRLIALSWVLPLAVTPPQAHSEGIPEPGIVLFGTVTDGGTGQRLTSGTITLTYTELSSGKSINVQVSLADVGEDYSYVAEIPFQTGVDLFAVSGSAFALPPPTAPQATTYERVAVFVPSTEWLTITFEQGSLDSITHNEKGTLRRLDLVAYWDPNQVGANGLPYAWQLLHFGHANVDPDGDEDGDGMSNRDEYRAGTDPLDPESNLRITEMIRSSDGFSIYWASVPNMTYSVLQSTDVAGPFTSVATGLSATPPENEFHLTHRNDFPVFFRVTTP